MKRVALLCLLASSLSACQTAQELIFAPDPPGSQANSAAMLAALAGGMAAGAQARANAGAAALANRPVHCTALQTGNITTTRCN